ncbi:DNA damage-responsive transcriptional repressor RPH1 [Podospora aff. communis PSN243]|uniref:[histone H3]-trimethyl-L-lysine(9) demethylase n=1 Tax=Podospora aff. communis PSN243 TaxID=3040156 RepID=A0AAV9H3P3_9PEZI|nr:DNA damage-responsive transcriptional repressor RPH1 [Podospora aff. communis PSN243]
MSTEAIGAAAPEATVVTGVAQQSTGASSKHSGLHSPPDSNNAMNLDGSDSELSDIDEVADKLNDKPHVASAPIPDEEPPPAAAEPEPKVEAEVGDIGEVHPDHWSGTVPVFKPTMKQFRDFKLFMEKVDQYGMKSGIIKIIPPQEWKDSLAPLDEMVKQIRVREPIKQDIMGSNGTYRQVNILHGRSYNLPQWRQLCDQSEHQPPARRGERRANAEKHKSAPRPTRSSGASKSSSAQTKKRKGRVTRRSAANEDAGDEERPMTPVSPPPEKEEVVESVEQDPGVEEECEDDNDAPVVRRMGFARQSKPKTQSTSARRKYQRREGSARIDEEAFRDWDYRMDVSDYTPERCEELERIYWKTLTYAPPLYGADLMGTLFHEDLDTWNLNKLPNLLDVLGTKVPGVNTAYLYLGMWKATFAWHLEDVDLYSINYLHFGAPKQWYSISQADARRFEAAMKNIWPTEAKACDQFLRHKAFLISPSHLKQNYGITVNKCLSFPGEFVVTYPYGYHSGYNLGYNCAEAVNFALDSWLPMGKIAKKCQCAQAQDSVWVDVYEIERKLRGEETDYEETEDEEDEEEEADDNDIGLPSPPSSHTVRVKAPGKKRKRGADGQGERKAKKIRLRLKSQAEPPCCLCPHDIPGAEMMATEDGRQAHRMCALYLPETYIETIDDKEVVVNINGIDKARLELKCLYCRSKKGACFQCSQKKCPRAYHATCAAAAGVFVEEAEVPVIGEDGTEYKEQAFGFSCRFHRTKRDKKYEGEALEDNKQIREAAAALKKHDICQIQFFRGDIFAGVVLENRHDEETLLLHVIPNGDRVEVEWKWLLLPDPADFRLPKASANAIPMPTSRKAQKELNAKRPVDDTPRKDDEFAAGFIWAEFHACDEVKNSAQVKVDLFKENQIWYYLGKTSTELRAQYTEDITKPIHSIKSNFLDSIPKPLKPAPMAAPPKPKRAYLATFPQGVLPKVSPVPLPGAVAASLAAKQDRPYIYKPRQLSSAQPGGFQFATQQFAPTFPPSPASQGSMPQGLMPQLQPHQLAQRPSQPQPQPPQQPVYHQQALQPRQGSQVAHQAQVQHQHPSQKLPSQQPLLIEQYRPLAMDPRPKKSSAAFSSDRFAPVGGSNGFPQLPGLTWPPAHMKSGHHFQPHADAAANGPPPTPMTSSAIKSLASAPQSTSPGAQSQAGAHQKYTFFQIHNNRDSARYRTPYGLRGGFTNGYEGNLRAFLIKAQRALSGDKTPLRAASSSSLQPLQPRPVASPGPSGSPSTGYSSPYSRLLPRPPQTATPRFAAELKRDASPAQHLPGHGPPGPLPIHPAYRQQSGSWLQSPASQAGEERPWSPYPNSPAPHSGEPHSRPPSQHGASSKTQWFTKQSHSPIPLPPYVKQAVATSSTPATKTSPLSDPISQSLVKSAKPVDGSDSAPYQHQQPQLPPATAEPPFDNSAAPAPPQDVSEQYIPPHQIQWAPTYSAGASPTTQQLEPSPSAYSTHQQPPPTTYYPAPDQQQGQPVAQYIAPQPGYLSTPAAVDPSADSVSMVERLMMNLKRATQQERSD